MNVRHIDKFIEDIDEKKLKDWQWEQDCHEKVRKITLYKEWALREIPVKETFQIVREKNPRFDNSTYITMPEERFRERWVLEDRISEKVVKELSKKFDLPVKTVDGQLYSSGEKV